MRANGAKDEHQTTPKRSYFEREFKPRLLRSDKKLNLKRQIIEIHAAKREGVLSPAFWKRKRYFFRAIGGGSGSAPQKLSRSGSGSDFQFRY